MFTPEFVNEESGEYLLVASHSLESAQSAHLSLAYNRARVLAGRTHLPARLHTCRIIYDIRGQAVAEETIEQVRQGLCDLARVEFKR